MIVLNLIFDFDVFEAVGIKIVVYIIDYVYVYDFIKVQRRTS